MDASPSPAAAPAQGQVLIRRHSLLVRITHWINVAALFFLLGSGLQIFNAHPALYWGPKSDFDRPWVSMTAQRQGGEPAGITQIGPLRIETTGVLGYSDGQARGFPSWTTIPSYRSLADGRRWHFFFAWLFVLNGLVYLAAGFAGGHFARDIAPRRPELSPRHLWDEVKDHARLRFPKDERAARYNTLQKLTYLVVIFVLLPLMLLTGLAMSPGFNAVTHLIFEMFGGRQSARTIHFISAGLIVAFVAVHLFMVLASGPLNNLRSMITGRYAIRKGEAT